MENKKYKIIYADPPWNYRDKANAGNRGASYKYPCMKLKDLKILPIKDLCEDDSVLFLWVTFPLLKEGLELIDSWGFKYKTLGFNWIKKNKKSDSLFWGLGNYTRSNSEVCLMAVRGKGVKRVSSSVHSVVMTKIREHSRNPDEIRTKIVELFGDIPRIELFARQTFAGWDSWGNETDKFNEVRN